MNYTEEQKKIIAENIWLRRQMLGMSKEELAEACVCGKNTINCWERGANVPPRNKIKELAKILKCSINELHRPYRIPKLSFVETGKLIEKKEEPIMSNEDIIKAASKVFKNSYVEPNTEKTKEIKETKQTEESKGHPVVDRVNKYLTNNNISQSELSRRIPMPLASLNRVVHGMLLSDNSNYIKVEEYLDGVEEVNTSSNTENVCQLEIKFDNPIKEQVEEEPKAEEKGSISERMNCIYNTLFNALDELDKLKADIDKIEKVTAMLKEIQGL